MPRSQHPALTRRNALRLAGTACAAGLAGCTVYPGYDYPYYGGYGPNMVWLPSANVYVGLGYSYPFFYWNNAYYYTRSGRWYTGPHWRGPWRTLPGRPRGLYGFHAQNWNRYQSRARYHTHNNPNWRHFRAK